MEKIKNPKITVITPTYNRADLIVETIESILSQDFKDFEYLILDDGSTDNTEEVVSPYLRDKRVRYLKHENVGEAETVNWGWSLAKGEYFTQVNSDDPILPGLFSEMVRVLDEKNEVVVAYPDFYFINEKGIVIKKDKTPDWNFVDALCSYSCYAASAGTFIRKTVFKSWIKIKNSQFHHISDVEMYWKMALKGEFFHVPKFLATWRVHGRSISAERYKSIPEVFKWFDDYFSQEDLPDEIKKCKNKTYESVYDYAISLLRQSNLEDKEEQILKFKNEFFKSYNLQIGDNDLVGNKFNGHDLHIYLNERGFKSKHLVWNKDSDDFDTFKIARDRSNRDELHEIAKLVKDSYSLDGTLNPIWHDVLTDPLFLNTEIVHFHLVHNGLIDLHLLPLMSKLKPIVWTLHDPWAFSGHCIEHNECNKWKNGCGDCPYLNVPFELSGDNSALNFELKKEAIRNSNIEIVTASKFMFEKAKQSPIFKGKNIHLIPFGIDNSIFNEMDKFQIRKKLNIPADAFVISFRSDTRYKKGVDYVEYVIKNLKTSKDVYFIAFGGASFYKNNKFNYLEYGWIKNDFLMADIYNASDLFLMPSTLESFGMMAIEAMSCGVLPIVLDGTALPEVVNAPECGISSIRDYEEYLKVVQYFCDNDRERNERGAKCLEFAKINYNKDEYINRIIDVYKQAKEKHVLDGESKILIDQLKKYAAAENVEDFKMNTNVINEETDKQKLSRDNNILDVKRIKNRIRKVLKKLIWYTSPTFRMLVGNRHRMDTLLMKIESIENLEKLNEQKTQNLLESIENNKAKEDESAKELKKSFLPKLYNENLNLFGERMYISQNHVSKVIEYDCDNVEFFEKMKKNILKTDVVLDIGCGIRPQTFFVPNVHICIEPFAQYRNVVKPFFPNNAYFVFLKEDALKAIKGFDDNSVDTVFMIDLIEHLEKEEGIELLKEADRVARKQVVVFTPLGFYPMHYKKEEKDAWGLAGIDVQEHKSGWLPGDFGELWDFHICKDCHEAFLPEEKAAGKKYSALMAIKTKNFIGFPIMDETPDFVKMSYEERILK